MKDIRLIKILFSVLCCCWFLPLVSAQNIPERPNPPRLVNDFANVLSSNQREELEKKLQIYNDTTSTQIAIITIKSTGDYPISDVALKFLRSWGVGSKKNNNGVVILAAVEDKKVRIETGYGMETVLNDGLCGTIIRDVMRPYFKKGDYYGGFSAASDEVIKAAKGEYQDTTEQPSQGNGSDVILVLIVLFFIFFILYRSNRGGGMMVSRRGYHPWGGGTWINTGGGGWYDDNDRRGGGGGWSGGGFDFGGGSGGGGGADGGW
jgi:uncharacterized protein